MSFFYLHGEHLMRFIVVMYALGMIAWAAILYGIIVFWQRRKEKEVESRKLYIPIRSKRARFESDAINSRP